MIGKFCEKNAIDITIDNTQEWNFEKLKKIEEKEKFIKYMQKKLAHSYNINNPDNPI